jgi:dolichol-phosphate mannosyltransferase
LAPEVAPSAALWQQSLLRHAGRFVRFGVVGASGVLVNSAVLFLLVEACHLHKLIAAAIATEVAIISNFILNDLWTFRDARHHRSWPRRLVRYNGIALGGLCISLGVLAALTMVLGIHYLLANLVGIAAATVWNYVVNSRLTWSLAGHGVDDE